MFCSFYLSLSILLCNVDSALVSDSNAYIWFSNCIQMFKLYSNVWIYIRMLKDLDVFLVHALEKWRLRMMWKNIWKRKDISLLLLLFFLDPKISGFLGDGGRGGVCAECDVTQEGSHEQTRQSVIVGGRWVEKGNSSVT